MTATCEFEETIRDEYGMACSEPELGVPTDMVVTCFMPATHRIVVTEEREPGEEVWLLCDEHADQMREVTTSEVLGLTVLSDVPVSTV